MLNIDSPYCLSYYNTQAVQCRPYDLFSIFICTFRHKSADKKVFERGQQAKSLQ